MVNLYPLWSIQNQTVHSDHLASRISTRRIATSPIRILAVIPFPVSEQLIIIIIYNGYLPFRQRDFFAHLYILSPPRLRGVSAGSNPNCSGFPASFNAVST